MIESAKNSPMIKDHFLSTAKARIDEVLQKEAPPQKTLAETLTENVAKADKMANEIRSKILMKEFTLAKMADLMRIPSMEARSRLEFLSRFAYLDSKKQGGILLYTIISDPKQRLKNIEATAATAEATIKAQLEYLETLHDITSEYVKEENGST